MAKGDDSFDIEFQSIPGCSAKEKRGKGRKSSKKMFQSTRGKPDLYKTEMCRSFTELGFCKYADKCQFCHSESEMREIVRHPKYKTIICRTFWLEGNCPYGKRCCFAHQEQITAGYELSREIPATFRLDREIEGVSTILRHEFPRTLELEVYNTEESNHHTPQPTSTTERVREDKPKTLDQRLKFCSSTSPCAHSSADRSVAQRKQFFTDEYNGKKYNPAPGSRNSGRDLVAEHRTRMIERSRTYRFFADLADEIRGRNESELNKKVNYGLLSPVFEPVLERNGVVVMKDDTCYNQRLFSGESTWGRSLFRMI